MKMHNIRYNKPKKKLQRFLNRIKQLLSNVACCVGLVVGENPTILPRHSTGSNDKLEVPTPKNDKTRIHLEFEAILSTKTTQTPESIVFNKLGDTETNTPGC